MDSRKLLGTGLIGSAVAMLCCFTPLLAVVLGALGLSAWLAWADYVLLPMLILSLMLIGYAVWRRRRAESRSLSRRRSANG
jgi:mercuric ion transport protein